MNKNNTHFFLLKKIIGKYKKCSTGVNCNCAIWIRSNSKNFDNNNYAYIDFCSKGDTIDTDMSYVGLDQKTNDFVVNKKFECSKNVINNLHSEKEWSKFDELGNFRCAKLNLPSKNIHIV